jgi:antitoxin CcdA
VFQSCEERATRPINLRVHGDLIEAARQERINLSALLERALEDELAVRRRRRWRDDNARAIAAYNRLLAQHGTFFRPRRSD